jgi:hypothetical protein
MKFDEKNQKKIKSPFFVGQTATVAMETKKGGFNFFFILFIKLHETLLEYAL